MTCFTRVTGPSNWVEKGTSPPMIFCLCCFFLNIKFGKKIGQLCLLSRFIPQLCYIRLWRIIIISGAFSSRLVQEYPIPSHTSVPLRFEFSYLCTDAVADCPAMSFVFVCWQINIRNTNQLSWADAADVLMRWCCWCADVTELGSGSARGPFFSILL